MDCILGIDPGFYGGFAFFNGSEVAVQPMPITTESLSDGKTRKILFADKIVKTMDQFNPSAIYIEKVHAMPNQGVTSMFRFGESYGIIQGIAHGLSIPVNFIAPREWKKHYSLKNDKQDSIDLVNKMFKEVKMPKNKQSASGVAEAILIAVYAWTQIEELSN